MRYVFLSLLFILFSSASWGQYFIPLTESTTSQTTLESSPTTAPKTFPQKQTRSLLQLQADKERPGQTIPLLGATVHRSWERYLNSFTHPLPQHFDERVSSQSP